MANAHGVEAISKMAEKYGSGRFIKLENDGDSVTVAFLGEPYAREVVWVNGGTEDYDDTSPDHEGIEPRLLVSWNVYDKELGEMRVFDQGITFFRKWVKCKDRYGIQNWFAIERDGKAGSKKTTYGLMRDEKIDDAAWAKLQEVELHPLGRSQRKSDDDDDDNTPKAKPKAANGKANGAATNGFVDAKVARDLAQRLKELPKESIDQFLEEFSVKRIKEVSSKDEAAALAFVEALERPVTAGSLIADPIDPFE